MIPDTGLVCYKCMVPCGMNFNTMWQARRSINVHLRCAMFCVPVQASTVGLVHELVKRDEAKGSRILCPVPSVQGECLEVVLSVCDPGAQVAFACGDLMG